MVYGKKASMIAKTLSTQFLLGVVDIRVMAGRVCLTDPAGYTRVNRRYR